MPARTTLVALALLLMALSFAGCGEDDPPSERDGDPESGALATAQAYLEAVAGGDGDAACSYLTDLGRQITVKVLSGETDGRSPGVHQYDPDDCPAAVDDPSVDVNEDDVPSLAEGLVTVSASGMRASVAEPGRTGNELSLVLVDGEWRIAVPIFTGR